MNENDLNTSDNSTEQKSPEQIVDSIEQSVTESDAAASVTETVSAVESAADTAEASVSESTSEKADTIQESPEAKNVAAKAAEEAKQNATAYTSNNYSSPYYTVNQAPQSQYTRQNPQYNSQYQYTGQGATYSYSPNTYNQNASTYGRPELVKKKKEKKVRPVAIIAACVLLSFIAGLGGAFTYAQLFGGSSSTTVLYETGRDTSSVTYAQDSNTASATDVVSAASASVVEITTESVTTNPFLGEYVTTGAGSGVIISEDGYIVTCAHVVKSSHAVKVKLADGTDYTATVVGQDTRTDVAVIKINANNLPAATLGNSGDLVVGETAIAIGNPLQLGGTVTRGIISSLSRTVTVEKQTMTLLQTDAAINPGNSGGGLFNTYGELIGIVNAKAAESGVDGLGFAIPIDTAKPVIESLISDGYVTGRPGLGISAITISTAEEAAQYGLPRLGVYIYSVNEGSGADRGGLKAGDYIVSINGKAVSTVDDISNILQEHEIGDTVTVQVIREEQTVTCEVVLSELKAEPVSG